MEERKRPTSAEKQQKLDMSYNTRSPNRKVIKTIQENYKTQQNKGQKQQETAKEQGKVHVQLSLGLNVYTPGNL